MQILVFVMQFLFIYGSTLSTVDNDGVAVKKTKKHKQRQWPFKNNKNKLSNMQRMMSMG